jgi:hypothetical protein
MTVFCRRVADLGVTVFLSHPERDARTAMLHNSVFVIAPDGSILGTHRKINTLPVGSEAWSTPGDEVAPIAVPPVGRVGVLVGADAYSPWIAKRLEAPGRAAADLLRRLGAGSVGPERRMGAVHARHRPATSGLQPNWARLDDELLGGRERGPQGRAALLSLRSERSAVFTIDWSPTTQDLAAQTYGRIDL